MPHADVVLGSFIRGLPQFDDRAKFSQPPWMPPPAVQPKSAVRIPPHLAHFARTGGQPLPPIVQARMRTVFGADFSDVRVHVGRDAPSLGAQAFAHGNNVYFAPGRYQPNTHQGMRLIAHELAHIVQMRTGRVRNPFNAGIAIVHDRLLEAEADRFGIRVVVMQPLSHGVACGRPAVLQGKPFKVVEQKGNWLLEHRPGFRHFVLPRLVERYNKLNKLVGSNALDPNTIKLSDEELDQCHIIPWAAIRDRMVEEYLNGDIGKDEFIERTNALYREDSKNKSQEWKAMNSARNNVIKAPDVDNVKELATLLNSATPNLRLDDAKINRKISDRLDLPLVVSKKHLYLRVESPERIAIEQNVDITKSPLYSPMRTHFFSSSVNNPVSPGKLSPRTRKLL